MKDERQELIRREFELYRDIKWFEDLEPKAIKAGATKENLDDMRKSWNEHTEERDWSWWRDTSQHYSKERLQDSIMNAVDRLAQLGCLKWQREHSDYKEMLGAAARFPSNDNEKNNGIDR